MRHNYIYFPWGLRRRLKKSENAKGDKVLKDNGYSKYKERFVSMEGDFFTVNIWATSKEEADEGSRELADGWAGSFTRIDKGGNI